MSSKIVIVDYGMGNLHSVNKAIAVVGGDPVISSDAAVIAQADKLILPGVGAFGDCMANLQRSGLVPILQKYLHSGRPFLGICLGMQVLFEGSDEAPGERSGLFSRAGAQTGYRFENTAYGLEQAEFTQQFSAAAGSRR